MPFRRLILAAISAACALGTPIFAQTLQTEFEEDFTRTGGVFHSYEFHSIQDTPAPEGYKPFYVSHYGRHGSRHQIGSGGTAAYERIARLDSAGLLTPAGKELFKDVTALYNEHIGMDGELSVRGGKEHVQIAKRMYGRFTDAFTDPSRTEVHCQSSVVPRCLISMANFVTSLQDAVPALDFDFVTGKRYMEHIAHGGYTEDGDRQKRRQIFRSVMEQCVHPEDFINRNFILSDNFADIAGDPYTFMHDFYMTAAIGQCLTEEVGVDLLKYLTDKEKTEMGLYLNAWVYGTFANSAEFGYKLSWGAKWLLDDFVQRADSALAEGSSTAADLRFGHDGAILPMACLMGLENISGTWPIAEANLHFPAWKYIPMGTNLQMVFYRSGSGPVLVKILYNEEETAIPAVPSFCGPYYRWDDLRTYFLSLSEDKSAPEPPHQK